jgi:type VI secretion system protein ImpC
MRERSSVGIEIEAKTAPSRVSEVEQRPFRIAIFGDFSGRANRGAKESPRAAKAWRVDVDNFDEVLKRCNPSLQLPVPGEPARTMPVTFTSFADFHPDALLARLPAFARLLEMRTRLMNPATFAAAAAELTGTRPAEAPKPKAAPAPNHAPDVGSLIGGSLLDRIVEGSEPGGQPDDLQAFVNRAVAGYIVPGKAKGQDEMVAQLEQGTSATLRRVLHHPDFQALEAAWSAVRFLIRRLEMNSELQIFLLDVSRQELADDLNNAKDLRATGFYHQAITAMAGDEPWALLVANYSFGPKSEDVELLARIAMIAGQAGAPFLAGADPAILGCESLAGIPEPREWKPEQAAREFWNTLRQLPEASYVGLVMPRFLLRMPYGQQTDPVETFPFEEMPPVPEHGRYLWGNPAVAVATLLAQAFEVAGWEMRPGAIRELSSLPLYIYRRDGESIAQPCAEGLLTDEAAEAISDQGIMPLLSAKDGDRILLARFQSVADPARALSGRW